MAKLLAIAFALFTALASTHCAGGGPSGTHLSAVTGNVVDARAAGERDGHEPTLLARIVRLFDVDGRAWAQSGVEGIRVRIEGTPFATVTDASGRFVIEGDFAGTTTVLFAREADGLAARIEIVVPEGGTVTLVNVSCRGSRGVCEAEDIDIKEPNHGFDDGNANGNQNGNANGNQGNQNGNANGNQNGNAGGSQNGNG